MTAAVRVHDLLHVGGDPLDVLVPEASWPGWARTALAAAPWVVVRRGPRGPHGEYPVGIRGFTRNQRLAAYLAPTAVAGRLTPTELPARHVGVSAERRGQVAALDAALAAVRLADGWAEAVGEPAASGPGGSVGFELATGCRTAHAGSDLDLIVRRSHLPSRADAAGLRDALAALPVRVDVLLEADVGGVSLAEYANGDGQMLLRTADGPRLVSVFDGAR